MQRLFFTYLFIFLFSLSALSQTYTYRDKAQAILYISEQTQWQDNLTPQILIFILSKDKTLYNYLDTIRISGRKLKDRDFVLKYFSKPEDLLAQHVPNIIYISKNFSDYTDTIANKFYQKGIMIFTDENKVSDKYIVNFLPDNKEKKLFEINYDEAQKRGFVFPERLLLLGGNEELLRSMYQDTVIKLRNQIEDLKKQVYIIEEKQRIIDLKKAMLKQLESQIALQQSEAEKLKDYIKNLELSLNVKKRELEQKQNLLKEQEKKLQEKKDQYEKLRQELNSKEKELLVKEQKIKNINKELAKAIQRIQTQADYIKLSIVILMALFFMIYLYLSGKKKKKEIEEKNKQITKINDELKVHQQIIEEKNKQLEQHIKEITWSLNYAQKIQESLLPTEDQLKEFFRDYFLIFKPRNIVSGDFYYINQVDKYKIFAVGDCTGHGVAGAFLSIMSLTALHDIVVRKHVKETGQVLDILREKIKEMFKHFGTTSYQGLDIAFCVYDTQKKVIQFSGAYNSLYLYNGKDIVEYKGTRNPVGYHPNEVHFETKTIPVKGNETIYLFTDGIYDQLRQENNDKRVKFSKVKFKKLLKDIADLPLKDQKQRILDEYQKWADIEEQTDDITVLAVKL